MAKPARQPQPQLKTKVPTLEAADLAQLAPPEAGRNLEDLPPDELQVVEDKINDLQNFVFSNLKDQGLKEELFQQPVTVGPPPGEPPKSLAEDLFGKPIGEPPSTPTQPTEDIYKKRLAEQKAVQPYVRQLQGAKQFERTLEVYRGRFAEHSLSDASWGLIFSALGPVGSLLQTTYHKKIAWQYTWGKNFLNPQAIFFYLNTLPKMKAFKFLAHPVKKTIGLLARSQNPLFSAFHYQDIKWDNKKRVWQPMAQTVYGFTPFLAVSKSAEKLADYIDDRLLGVKWLTDKQGRRLKKLNDPWRINHRLAGALTTYEKAKKSYLSSRIVGDRDTRKKAKQKYKASQKNIFQILKDRDDGGGFIGFFRNSLGHPLKRASKNLRDGKLLLLIGNFIWDFFIGIAINTARYIVTRIVSRIPGLAHIRARLTRFFTSPRWLNNINMGRQTLAAQAKGLISLNTFSGGFLGAQAMAPFGTQAMYAGGFLGGAVGWQYQALLNMANNPTLMDFARYPQARAIRALGRIGAPGPMLRAAYWLEQNPWFRIPLKGAFLGQLVAPFLEELYGINPATTFWSSTAINYFWASRKFWLQKVLARPFGRLAVRFGLPPKLVKSFFQSPGKVFFKTLYESGLAWPVKKLLWSWRLNVPIQAINKFLARPLVQKFIKNMLANPGFFMGFELISILHAAGLPWLAAIPLGPLVGGITWNVGAFVIETITGISKATISSLGWAGFTIGWLGEIASNLFGFTLPSWWSITGLTLALPFSWALVYGFGQLLSLAGFWSVPGLIGFGIVTAMEGLLAGGLVSTISATMAALAVPFAIIFVAGFALFISGVLTASVWVPFTSAPTSSSCLQLQVEAKITTNESVDVCATLTILPNPLLLKEARIQCVSRLHPVTWELKNSGSQNAVRASRQLPGQSFIPLNSSTSLAEVLGTNNHYFVSNFPYFHGAGSFNELLPIDLSVLGNDAADGTHISGMPLSVLMGLFPNLASQTHNLTTYLEIIQNHPDPGTAKLYLIDEQKAQITLIENQQFEIKYIIKDLNNIQNQLNKGKAPAEIIDDLQKLLEKVNLLITLSTEPNFYYQSELAKAQADLDACSENYSTALEINSCEQHYQNLISTYESWPTVFREVPGQLEDLIDLAGQPDTSEFFSELAKTIASIEEFYQTLPNTLSGLEFVLEKIKDIDLSNILAFLDKKFYYLPGDTVYKMCYTATLIQAPGSKTASFLFECTAASAAATDFSPAPHCQVLNHASLNVLAAPSIPTPTSPPYPSPLQPWVTPPPIPTP